MIKMEKMNENLTDIINDHEQRIKKIEELLSKTDPKPIAKKLSIKEFLLSKSIKDELQKTLAIGYFFEKYDGLVSFNAKDIEDGFRQARETVPKNINDTVNKNISKGYIMEAKAKKDKLKAWNLTNSGERFVENDFTESHTK